MVANYCKKSSRTVFMRSRRTTFLHYPPRPTDLQAEMWIAGTLSRTKMQLKQQSDAAERRKRKVERRKECEDRAKRKGRKQESV